MARKSKYDTVIPPNIEQIKEWLSRGVPERDIAKNLGVAYSTWKNWKKDHEEFLAIFDHARRPRITELENTMFKLATGFSIEKKSSKVVKNADGSERIDKSIETVYYPPNFNALRFLLTNWSENYSNDPALIRQRKEEFEHKKKIDELNNW